jgi:hypothetical protein
VATLVPEVRAVEMLHTDEPTLVGLRETFGTAVVPARELRTAGSVLVTPAKVAFAVGSLSRLSARADTPGRVVTRVFVPGLDRDEGVAWWSAEWAAERDLTATDLAGAGVEFDRTHLPHESSRVRAWVRADEIGIASVADIRPGVQAWSRTEGRRLGRNNWYTAVGSRAGVVKRRLALRQQRGRLERSQRTR